MTFDETLARVLDPAGVYWTHAGEDDEEPSIERTIQLRLDVPINDIADAVSQMQANGWTFTEQPDDADDLQQRLFFQRQQNLLPETKVGMLTDALKVVHSIRGARLWTWIVIDHETEN